MEKLKKKFIVPTLMALGLLLTVPLEARAITASENYRTTVSPGVIRREIRVNLNGRNHIVDLIEVDLKNPNADLQVVAGRGEYTQKATVSQMAARTDAFAMINGDFFNMSKQGSPFGPSVVNGKLQTSPLLSVGLNGFGIDSNRQAYIGPFTFKGTARAADGASFPISGLNKTDYVINHTGVPSHKDSIQVYNDFWAAATRGLKGSGEVLLNGNHIVEQISLNGPLQMAVPDGKYILQVNGLAKDFIANHVKVGSKLSLNYNVNPNRDWKFLIGGHAMLVDNGQPLPYNLDADAIGGRRARSGVGISADGKKVLLASTEGKTKRSPGMQLNEWTVTLQGLGAYKALNLDGGGSTTMVARDHGAFENDVITRPEGNGSQRKIVNGIGVMNKAPQGPLANISLSGPSAVVKGEVATYGIDKGWDANFHPKDVSQLDYAISDTVIGPSAWSGNRFLSSSTGKTTVRLQTMSGIVGTKEVRIDSPTALKSLDLKGETKGLTEGANLWVSLDATTKAGRKIKLDPSQIQWTLEGLDAQGEFSSWKVRGADGKLKDPVGVFTILDLKKSGFGKITASHGNQSDSLYIDSPYFKKLHMIIGNPNYSIDKDWFVMDTKPIAYQDRTMVPLRFLAESFGAQVDWNQESQTATVLFQGKKIDLPINSKEVYVNGQTVSLDVPAIARDDRTLVPIRFVTEQLGMQVNYIPEGKFVDIYQVRK